MAERVLIFDTTLRDGEQSPGCSMHVREKRRMAAKLVDLGVDVLEAGFPIASDGDFESVRLISGETRGVTVAALARACETDITRAAKALEDAERPRIHTFIATSENHLKYKLRKSREQVLEDAVAAVRLARRYVDDVEFSAEDAARTELEYLSEVTRAVIAEGAGTVNIPDTVGYCTPDEFGSIISSLVAVAGDAAAISVHCHNDLGLAVANSLAAVQAGARQVECTINGIGERAGNCALEEIVMILEVRKDRLPYRTGINTDAALSRQPAPERPDRVRPAAEQVDRRTQRVRARSGHPPGRRPQGADDVRDHRPGVGGCAREPPGARQAQRPPRPALAPGEPRLLAQPRAARRGLPPVHHPRRPQEGRDRRGNRRVRLGAAAAGRVRDVE